MHNYPSLYKIIDYTLLDPAASEQEILDLCAKAIKLQVASVCITPDKVQIAKQALENTSVLVCTVVSFPTGENSIVEKVNETTQDEYQEVDDDQETNRTARHVDEQVLHPNVAIGCIECETEHGRTDQNEQHKRSQLGCAVECLTR